MSMRARALSFFLASALAACSSGEDAADVEGESEPQAVEAAAILSAADAANCGLLTERGQAILYEDAIDQTPDGDLNGVRPVTIPGLDEPLETQLVEPSAQDDRYEVRLDFTTEWEGLPVTGLGYRYLPRTDMATTTLLYLDMPVADAAEALEGLGYPVAADGSMKATVQDSGGEMYQYWGIITAIEPVGERTALFCSETGWDEGDI